MKKRISKRVREEAAMLCAVVASNRWMSLSDGEYWLELAPSKVAGVLDAFSLAHAARVEVDRSAGLAYDNIFYSYQLRCAEAESLLRCGWSPP